MCGWTYVGQRALPNNFTGMRQNWSLADGAVGVSALQGATRSVPIVFVAIPDPVAPFRQEPGTTGRQYNWVYRVRIRYRGEVARTA